MFIFVLREMSFIQGCSYKIYSLHVTLQSVDNDVQWLTRVFEIWIYYNTLIKWKRLEFFQIFL